MLKALGFSSPPVSRPSSQNVLRLSVSSVASISNKPGSVPSFLLQQPPNKRPRIVQPPEKVTSSLHSDLSPNFFSPTPRFPSPASNPYLPRPPPNTIQSSAAWASSGPDPRILDVRGRMWGLDKDTRHFVPDEAQRDRTMRSEAVKSLTSAAGSSIPKDKDKDETGGDDSAGGGSQAGDQLPWGSYLEKKREKDRERDGKRSASKGGGGWLPFWKSTGLGRLERGWGGGGGAMQLAAISMSLERRASYESQAKERYDRDEHEFLSSKSNPFSSSPPGSSSPPSSSPPPPSSQSARLASALGLSTPPPPNPLSPFSSPSPPPRSSVPSSRFSAPSRPSDRVPPPPSFLGFSNRSTGPSFRPQPQPPRHISPSPTFRRPPPSLALPPPPPSTFATPFSSPPSLTDAPPPPPPSTPTQPLELPSSPPFDFPPLPPPNEISSQRDEPTPSDPLSLVSSPPVKEEPSLVVNPGYSIDPSYESTYLEWERRRRYPSQVEKEEEEAAQHEAFREEDASKPNAWSVPLLELFATGPQEEPLEEFEDNRAAAPKVPFNQLLEVPEVSRPPHPFKFVVPDNPSVDEAALDSSEDPATLNIKLEPNHPPTLRLLVVAIGSFAHFGFSREAISILDKVWPGWSAGSSPSSSSSPSTRPPPMDVYLPIIWSFLRAGQWEDALAWIETAVVRAGHPLGPSSYFAFFKSFEWSKDASNAEALFLRLKADEQKPLEFEQFSRRVFQSLMKAGGLSSGSKGLETARHWFAKMDEAGFKPSLQELRILMDAATSANDRVLAQKIWRVVQATMGKSKQPKERSTPETAQMEAMIFNSFLFSLQKSFVGWPNTSAVISEAIKSGSLVPNRGTYHLAIKSAVEGGFVREAVEIIEFMENEGVNGQTFKATNVTFTILLAGILRRHAIHPSEIRSLQNRMEGQALPPWTTPTLGDGSGHKIRPEKVMEQALNIIEEMKRRELSITSGVYYNIISYLGRLPVTSDLAIRLSNQLLNDLPKAGETFTEKNSWAILSLTDSVSQEEMLLRLLVRFYGVRGQFDMAEAVTEDLLERFGDDVGLRTLEEALLAAYRGRNEELMKQLWEVAVQAAVRETEAISFESEVEPSSETGLATSSSLSTSDSDVVNPSSSEASLFLDITRSPLHPSSTSSSTSPSDSNLERYVPPTSAHKLSKSVHLLLVFFVNRGPISEADLSYITEQWRLAGSLGFGFDRKCWEALASVYVAVGQPEKAFQICNDIICWKFETLARKFEALVGRTIKGMDISEARRESEESWKKEVEMGDGELPVELEDAPEDFKRVIRTSFGMVPSTFTSRLATDLKSQTFGDVFPPAPSQSNGQPFATPPEELEPSSASFTLVDEQTPSQAVLGSPPVDNGALGLSSSSSPPDPLFPYSSPLFTPDDSSSPSSVLQPDEDRGLPPHLLSRAPPPPTPHRLRHSFGPLNELRAPITSATGLRDEHLELHPSIVADWLLSHLVRSHLWDVLLDMDGAAKAYDRLRRQPGFVDERNEGEENPIERLDRFAKRYPRAIEAAKEWADAKALRDEARRVW